MSDQPQVVERLTIEFAGDTPIYPSENGRWVLFKEHERVTAPLVAELEETRKALWDARCAAQDANDPDSPSSLEGREATDA